MANIDYWVGHYHGAVVLRFWRPGTIKKQPWWYILTVSTRGDSKDEDNFNAASLVELQMHVELSQMSFIVSLPNMAPILHPHIQPTSRYVNMMFIRGQMSLVSIQFTIDGAGNKPPSPQNFNSTCYKRYSHLGIYPRKQIVKRDTSPGINMYSIEGLLRPPQGSHDIRTSGWASKACHCMCLGQHELYTPMLACSLCNTLNLPVNIDSSYGRLDRFWRLF
jgi:hypothetical protein